MWIKFIFTRQIAYLAGMPIKCFYLKNFKKAAHLMAIVTYIDLLAQDRLSKPGKDYSVHRVEKDNWMDVSVPALMDEALFDTVQEQLSENRKLARTRRRGSLFAARMPVTANQTETNGEKRFRMMLMIAALALTLTVLEEIKFVIIDKCAWIL